MDIKTSDYHWAQSDACFELAKRHEQGSDLWKAYRRQHSTHHSLAFLFVFLEEGNENINKLECEARAKAANDERIHWKNQQIVI